MLRKTAAAGMAVFCCMSPAQADQAATTLPPIVVTAGRVAQTAEQTLASVTVIERAEIERSQAASVPDLLRKVPGLAVVNNGGLGKASAISLRRSESDHVLVLVDGVKVSSATLGSTAIENLPLELIERIEVVRGPRSSLYGSEAIGGVIQIFTRKGGGSLTPSLSLGGGSYGTYQASAGLSGGGEQGWFNVGISGQRSDGFNACNGEPQVAGCFTHEPDKDGYENLSASLRAGYRFDNGLELDANWLRAEGDSDYDGDFENETETLQQVLGASARFSPLDVWGVTLQIGRSWDESDNYKDGLFSSSFDTVRDSFSWLNELVLADDQRLTLGLDYQDDRVDGSVDYAVSERDVLGVFGQYLAYWGRHNLQAAVRHDENEQFGGHATGSLAWGYDFSGGLRVSLSHGTAFKAPTFNELYFPFFGNPDLKPEESASTELGLSQSTAWGEWSVNLFQTDVDELITFDANTFAPANIDSARIRGLEARVGTRVVGWDVNAQLTLLDPVNQGVGADGNLLPRRARRQMSLEMDRSFGAYSLGATLIGVGKRYDDIANSRELDAYAILNLRGQYRVNKAWRIQARVENLFDADYETASFYNQPGLSAYLTLRYQP